MLKSKIGFIPAASSPDLDFYRNEKDGFQKALSYVSTKYQETYAVSN